MRRLSSLIAGAALFIATVAGLQARQASTTSVCRATGHVTGVGVGLPGVAITAQRDNTVQSATATGLDGSFTITLPYGAYHLTFELTGFDKAERDLTVGSTSCEQKVDVALTLTPRAPRQAAAGNGRRGGFQTLTLQQQQAASAELPADDSGAAAALLLPPGFAAEASANAIAVNGSDARVDRGQLNDRSAALGRGDFPAGDIPPELLAQLQAFGGGGAPGGGPGGPGRPGGPGGPGGFRGEGGGFQGGGRGAGGQGGGRGNFAIGGRQGRQGRINANADYGFGGSVLDATPYQLRPDVATTERPYMRQTFSTTIGGPLKIPHLYDGRRTTFTVTYNGSRGASLFDQYATVPTEAMRNGDLSSVHSQLFDPISGAPFANNQIPASAVSLQARTLLNLIPLPNLSGTTRNYHLSTTTSSTNDGVNVRLTQSFGGNPAAGFGGRGGGGFAGRGGGRGGAAARGTTVALNAQVQYRNTSSDQLNIFSALNGHNSSTSLSTPFSLNIVHNRIVQQINVQYSRTESKTRNQFTGVQNIAAEAGIEGVATSPLSWTAPTLSFSSITGLRGVTPSLRRDQRVQTSYTWNHPLRRHTLRLGGDFQWDTSSSRSDQNASGTFLFTGLYTGLGAATPGADFADFLLGMPQQASVSYGPGTVTLKGKSTSAFIQDDWRWRPNLTFNLGVRYELLWPFTEAHDHLVNLDVTPTFTAAAPVLAGDSGPYTGSFPSALVDTDRNNVAPRLGAAWRVKQMIVRGGYGVSYNSGAYATMARNMALQPPFATANTQIGTINEILLMESALANPSPDVTSNTFGTDKDYALGLVQTWNVDVTKNLKQVWQVGAGYTYTRGTSLDIVRAPNRGPQGLRIEDVSPFTWQSSEGESRLHSGTFRVQRRQARGLGFNVTYTLARSRDNAPSIGGGSGASVVAQNDQDIAAEWGLSNFDRRQRLNATSQYELPFGKNRKWLNNGGAAASIFEGWRLSGTFQIDAGSPLTARVQSSARDAAQGVNGALRADYTGAPITLHDPTIDEFFNVSAFALPLSGFYGNSARNVIIGPGSKQLDAQISRDVRLGGNRALTIDMRITNLLNNVNYSVIDTYVNSPTFGQVLGVRPMRSAQLNLRFRY